MASCSAMAALQSATNPTSNEVDDAWFHLWHAIHHRPRLTVARGSSLMLRTRALTHTGEDGHTIFEMDLRFESNPLRVTPHISLTALARSAQCTGFYAWILDALSHARALTISRAWCTVAGAHAHLGPAHVGYTQNLKSVA